MITNTIDLNETLANFLRDHLDLIYVDKNGFCAVKVKDKFYYITVKGGLD